MELCPGRYVGESFSPFIIAEIGQNHQGGYFTSASSLIQVDLYCTVYLVFTAAIISIKLSRDWHSFILN